MPLQFVAQGPMQLPATGVGTFPDAVAGLVGGGASYTGWWGLRAYSQAVATSGIRAIQLQPAIAGGGNVDIHVTSTGILSNADLNLVDFTSGSATVMAIDNQIGGTEALFPHSPRPLFFRNYFQTNHHAILFGTNNTSFDNDALFTWPASTSGFIFTAYIKYVSGDVGGARLVGDVASSHWYVSFVSSGDVKLVQDVGDVGHTESALVIPDTPCSTLFYFNGASSAINKDGADHTFDSNGTLGITTGSAGVGMTYGLGGNDAGTWAGHYLSEWGYMSATKSAANTIDATKRSAITNEMKAFYT